MISVERGGGVQVEVADLSNRLCPIAMGVLRFNVFIREDTKVLPFSDVNIGTALPSQLIEDLLLWSEQGLNPSQRSGGGGNDGHIAAFLESFRSNVGILASA